MFENDSSSQETFFQSPSEVQEETKKRTRKKGEKRTGKGKGKEKAQPVPKELFRTKAAEQKRLATIKRKTEEKTETQEKENRTKKQKMLKQKVRKPKLSNAKSKPESKQIKRATFAQEILEALFQFTSTQ